MGNTMSVNGRRRPSTRGFTDDVQSACFGTGIVVEDVRTAIDGDGRAGVPDHPLDRCSGLSPSESAGFVRLGRLSGCSFFQHREQRAPNESVEFSFAGVIRADCGEHFVV